MQQFRKKRLILYLLIPLAVLAWMVLPAHAGADPAGLTQETSLTAEADPDNVIARAFASLINGDGENSEASLEEYPLDPHELEEYGDSIRVRSLTRSTKDEPSYLVYREDLYLIPQEEAAAYTVVQSEDGLTAKITPALPEGVLEGKSGLVLLGEKIGQDKVLLFDGEPVLTAEGLTVSLLPEEKVSLNRIFSDGQFTTSVTADPPARFAAPAAVEPPSARSFGVRKAPLGLPIPTITYSEDINKTNLTGKIQYNANDFKLKVSFKVKPKKLDFGLNIDIAAKAYFDLTNSGAVSRQTIFSKDVDLFSEDLFDVNLKYQVQAKFNDVPVHVTGHIDNSVTYVFGVIGATL